MSFRCVPHGRNHPVGYEDGLSDRCTLLHKPSEDNGEQFSWKRIGIYVDIEHGFIIVRTEDKYNSCIRNGSIHTNLIAILPECPLT